ncbi:DNA adenine methylase [Bacillus sp. FJAT-45350]|uniref:DNA adenine methylase n=1 Tax=Bacillus sp. FJAT-45350 TaxID=2011014 RepID=UPI000BB6D2B7|nr:DNA adenine methylase [Bacillus sp. FJAT-45350]
MNKTSNLQPFLKWAGGKRQLLPVLRQYLPEDYNRYFEPFIGAGALLFDIAPKEAYINDVNQELVNVYQTIRDDVHKLITYLEIHAEKHGQDENYYYIVREWDRNGTIENISLTERAARVLYLNKTCFNGLYRVNSKGQYNVPKGSYKNPNIVNSDVLLTVHDYLNKNNVTITNEDFAKTVLEEAKKGDLVYFDPPYDPVSTTSSFTSYSQTGFGKEEQVRLKDVFVELADRGCYVMLSNSYTDFIRDLYGQANFEAIPVKATRSINSKATSRGKIDEAVILSYVSKDKK